MLIIPVIDLMGGKVVHAQGGRRDQYQPLTSQLTSSVYPNAVIKQLLKWYPFTDIYIADLDAIECKNIDKAFYLQLHHLFPQLTIWLDAGIRTLNDWQYWCDIPNIKPVLGSETLQDLQLLNKLQPTEFILSLDFRQGQLLGQYDLLTQVDLWPDTIIVMSLDTVGMDNGPDEKLLNTIQKIKPGTQLIAAGGVRGEEDLMHLAKKQIKGALIASALHKGRLGVDTIRQIMN
ncbi:HisA/HisF-related TIM barrel protein [uncultured Methylophaga sp.]|uniref:HisA/HisF-related TIM barrel protein n=1 Tax=uncultured Methylophaga sp. TaxID=285271 RepID=UPI00262FE360|nr:HisA/HisF-related TIM barrel protein [uncultured Methylophaga sp.]